MNDASVWLPPPELSISEWADNYRYLSHEASAEPGRWDTSRAEYQREMMDAVKTCERVIIMTAAQVGKSELLLNTIGYFVDKDPSPILMLQPTLQMGEDFSKDRVEPMIRDTPCLSAKISQKARTRDNNILHKKFANSAVLTITGANSPASLASRPIRILLCDEVDRYPESAGSGDRSEGDPLSLAMKRTANFWNRRIVLVSTPTLKSISRIEKAYALSTREEWCVPCPVCGEYQPYSWERVIYKDRIIPVMRCASCGHEGSERDWKAGRGKWIANEDNVNGRTEKEESGDEEMVARACGGNNSDAVSCAGECNADSDDSPGVKQIRSKARGFHMNAFASPWVKWEEIIASYHEAYSGGEEMLKTWYNTVLGEPYELREGTIDAENITSRTENYTSLPDGVLMLTAGVDVQDNRLEVEVLGWGNNYETWGVEYRILYGTPGASEVWEHLDEYLSRTWPKADGTELGISAACIDSGGHFTDNVYKFVQTRLRRHFFAVVGRGTFGHPCVSGPTRNNRRKIPLFTLGVSTLKGMLFSRLQAEKGEPGYCHFPSESRTGYDGVYFKGLLSERMVMKRRSGRDTIDWEKKPGIKRNEPLDCRIYAMGAYEILNPKLSRPEKAKSRPSPRNPDKVYKPPVRGLLRRRIML